MASTQIKLLRRCRPEDRKAAALALARTQRSVAVDELKRMAEGGHPYTKDDQLVAIEALGETRSRRALEYLSDLYQATVSLESNQFPSPHSHYYYETETREWNRYEKVKGALRDELDYSVTLSMSEGGGNESPFDPAEVDSIRAVQIEYKKGHRVFRTAIEKLSAPEVVDAARPEGRG